MRARRRLTLEEIDRIDQSIPTGTALKVAKYEFARKIEDALSEPEPETGMVKVPTSIEEAEAMWMLAYAYLRQYAPERLDEQKPEPKPEPVTSQRAAMQQALEALRELLPSERDPNNGGYDARDVRDWRATESALKAALAEPEPKSEAVSWQCREHGSSEWCDCSREAYGINPRRYVYRRLYADRHASRACWCETCDKAANVLPTRMSLCPNCGDKRCPRAEYHGNGCREGRGTA